MSEQPEQLLEEFLVDGHEALDLLSQDITELERDPGSRLRLQRAFRRLHTLKGTCPFFGFTRLEKLMHAGETLLARLRDGELVFTAAQGTALFALMDTTRTILATIEMQRREPAGDDTELIERLTSRDWSGTGAPDAGAAEPRETGADTAETGLQNRHVRLDVRLLDHLVNLVGELVLARNQLVRTTEAGDSPGSAAATQRVDHVTSRLQEEIMRTRMQPVTAMWARLPRLVRETATACGRKAHIEFEGGGTELDKTVVDALKDPLTHLVRNAVDHGIEDPEVRRSAGKPEEGRLVLRAWQQSGSVHLELSDDGAGLSPERIRARALERGLVSEADAATLVGRDWYPFIFRAGFSTATRVTSISGRGVGMEVVESAVRGVGGRIELDSEPGRGTRVRISIPLTLAILPALTVEDAGERYAIPRAHLDEVVRPNELDLRERLEVLRGLTMFRLRGKLLPVRTLRDILGSGPAPADAPEPRLIVLHTAEGRFGLVVDALLDTEEIVVKPLGRRLRSLQLFAGAAVRGDGRVALILDVPALADGIARSAEEPAERVGAAPTVPLERGLLVQVRPGRRALIPVSGVQRIAKFAMDRLERRGELDFALDDGVALPVRRLAEVHGGENWDPRGETRDCPVLVHERDGQRWGFVVEAVEDIVKVALDPEAPCALIGEQVTEVLDLAAVAAAMEAA